MIVASSGNSRRTAVKQAVSDMSVVKANFLGVVLNKVSKKTSKYYSYNYDYGFKRKS